MRRVHYYLSLLGSVVILAASSCTAKQNTPALGDSPRIVNIINFVRAIEPRTETGITEDQLYEATEKQVELLEQHKLRGTFLLQYDAMIVPRYQALMRRAMAAGCEIGAWWEITEPHVKAAGLSWRGAFPWDWHANVGFASGYMPAEREKLVDVYMTKFKELFGAYPTAVGSWFIDAHTLAYMADHYQIDASCNCRDQVGTDGYTLWGGYWNQGYYPSRNNAYMPAQNAREQISIPIFRMLGSDPINQYDSGIGHPAQGVETLEPVYGGGGGNPAWIDWFFKMFTSNPCLAFQYVQVGQENSFTWGRMQTGLEYQLKVVDSLARAGKVSVVTLSEAGRWFKQHYKVTPSTSVVALDDPKHADRKSVWFDSRFYRANLLWEDSTVRFRDIHLFDERLESAYLTAQGTSTQCLYTTLPLVDGFNWSTTDDIAGLRLVSAADSVPVRVGTPTVEQRAEGELAVTTPILSGGSMEVVLNEQGVTVTFHQTPSQAYCLLLHYAPQFEDVVPFTGCTSSRLTACVKGVNYGVNCTEGTLTLTKSMSIVMLPSKAGVLKLDMSQR